MINFIRWLLLPLSFLYACIIWVRNRLYDLRLLKSTSFNIPVVVIGNLSVGGTGKSPMTEYVLRILWPARAITVLSRGYGRKTKGFREVSVGDDASQSGDEPLQIKRKFPETSVVVCEDRVKGIQHILPHVEGVLLDDAYQHRALTPSFAILLFDYRSLLAPRLPLPTGNFRDGIRESKRANIIVINKCPADLNASVKFELTAKLRAFSQAEIFFAKIAYDRLTNSDGAYFPEEFLEETAVLLVTGIANPQPLYEYLSTKVKSIQQIRYSDHHQFTAQDQQRIAEKFNNIPSIGQKIIITTEKDIQRLSVDFLAQYPIYFTPIYPKILFDEAALFEKMVRDAFGKREM